MMDTTGGTGEAASPEARELLGVLAFLGPSPVPLWLFAEGSAHLPSPLDAVADAGTGSLETTVRELVDAGLARLTDAGVALEPEVAAAGRESLAGVERSRSVGTALALLDEAFPDRVGREEDVARCELLAPWIEAVAGHVAGGGRSTERAAHLLARLGSFRALSGRPEEARRALRRAVALAEGEEGGGPLEGPLRAVLADEHASVLAELDRPGEAAGEARRAASLARELLPDDAPQLPVFLLNVGRTLRQAGDAAGAEEALREALERAESADSPAARPLVVEARLALAEVALGDGRPEDAADAARGALEAADEERAPGLAARATWILADALGEAGSAEEATRYYRRSLELDTRRYGARHPGVGQKALGLGLHLERRGLSGEAEEAYERALSIFGDTLGPDSEPARAARSCLERVRG
ncbi:MAG TPA: tetratricopeptide repeat protein [Gemmatimonadota bacterium]|nr:tetratricopeptide repeat protein [Gemmatimonadota bacterium]